MRSEKLRIDNEFSTLILPLAAEESQQLEELIVTENRCRDPLATWRGILIGGHARYQICRKHGIPFQTREIKLPNREAVKEWIIKNQLGRRNLPLAERCRLVCLLKPEIAAQAKERQRAHGGTAPGRKSLVANVPQVKTRDELARVARVSPRTMQDYLKIHQRLSSEQVERINRGETTIGHIKNEMRVADALASRKAQRAAADPNTLDKLHVGDFRDWKIPDSSLDLLLADPPWEPSKENLQLLIDLAILAEKKLLEGGSLVCYLGQILVDHAAAAFRQHLKYHWIFSAPRGNGKLFNRSDSYRILSQWRCVLWYVKGSYIAPRQKALGDVLPPSAPEKLYHEWQQPLPEAIYLIDGICPPDGLVGDPMICSGTTAVAAEKTGRRWVGCEIDPQIANIASKRIKEERRKSSAFGGAVGPSAPDRGKEPRNGQSRG